MLPTEFQDDLPYDGNNITGGYTACINGYVDYNYMSRTEGAFKCPAAVDNIKPKDPWPESWSRHFSASISITPRFAEYLPNVVVKCTKTTDILRSGVLIGDCNLKPSGGLDASVWFRTDPRTGLDVMMGAGGDETLFGPWAFQTNWSPWSQIGNPQYEIDFYGHPGDRANLATTGGSIKSIGEINIEDWAIR